MASMHNLSLGKWIAYNNPNDILKVLEDPPNHMFAADADPCELERYHEHMNAGSLAAFTCQMCEVAKRAQAEYQRGVALVGTPAGHAASVKPDKDPGALCVATRVRDGGATALPDPMTI